MVEWLPLALEDLLQHDSNRERLEPPFAPHRGGFTSCD